MTTSTEPPSRRLLAVGRLVLGLLFTVLGPGFPLPADATPDWVIAVGTVLGGTAHGHDSVDRQFGRHRARYPAIMGRRKSRGNRAEALAVNQENSQRKSRRVAVYAVVAPLVLTAVMATVFFQEAVDVVVGSTGVDPTSIETRWPLKFGCDLDGVVAMPHDGKKLDELGITFTEDPRQTAVKSGAGAWGRGTLYVSLRTSKDNEVVVNSVQPRHVTRTDEVAVDWLLSQPSACGGTDTPPRAPYQLDLETGSFTKVDDEGRAQPLDFVDRVVKVDGPFTFFVDVTGCSGTYRWLLEVKYSYRGHEYTRTVGSVENPLLSMGGRTGAAIYESNSGTTESGRWYEAVPSLEKPPCE